MAIRTAHKKRRASEGKAAAKSNSKRAHRVDASCETHSASVSTAMTFSSIERSEINPDWGWNAHWPMAVSIQLRRACAKIFASVLDPDRGRV